MSAELYCKDYDEIIIEDESDTMIFDEEEYDEIVCIQREYDDSWTED